LQHFYSFVLYTKLGILLFGFTKKLLDQGKTPIMIQSVNDPPLSNPENLQEKGIASRDASLAEDEKKYAATLAYRQDAFGDESNAEVKYKVMKWW
jgi:hypothetical protein